MNHVVPDLDADAFAATLDRVPAVVSFGLDDAGTDLIGRVHDAGSLVMQQITTVQQAQLAVEHGADIVVAQGGEAGGYAGTVSTLSLVPQVVDAVSPVPVVAAGGIADGRGIAAAVTLGASGVNLGSRFLASVESPVGERWKKALVTYPSEDWIQAGFINAMNPNPGTLGYRTRLRLLRTEFVERWEERTHEVEVDSAPVMAELAEAVAAGDREALLVVGGQSAGLIRVVEPTGRDRACARRRQREALAEGAKFQLSAAPRFRLSRSGARVGDCVWSTDRPTCGPSALGNSGGCRILVTWTPGWCIRRWRSESWVRRAVELDPEVVAAVRRLGAAIAGVGCTLITGACPGLPMEAVVGAKRDGRPRGRDLAGLVGDRARPAIRFAGRRVRRHRLHGFGLDGP